MLIRAVFMKAAVSVFAAATSPSPLPAATASPNRWDTCTTNPALPYDHPLELQMRVLDGPDFDLLKYRGRSTLLHIFATWCEPCAIEMPHIVELANEYVNHGLAVVGIDFEESDDTVRAYRKKYDIPFPIAMDVDGGFTRALQSPDKTRLARVELPASLYITPEGYLYCFTKGTTNDPGPELTYRIKKFLKAASS